MKTEKIKVRGMRCKSCEQRIEGALKKVEGVVTVKASQQKGEVEVVTDDVDRKELEEAIRKEGYSVGGGWFWVAMGVAALFAAALFLENLGLGIRFPEVGGEVGYVALFVLGLATGFHCIAMCGGFVVSYSSAAAGKKSKPAKYQFCQGRSGRRSRGDGRCNFRRPPRFPA